jgi:hypothetical protein
MLELARPEVRAHSSHSERLAWGIVDVILAVLMLPFGLAMFSIECIVGTVASIFSD